MIHPTVNAREEILARIRSALEGADRSPADVPRSYRTPPPADPATLVDRFVARVEDYRAVVTRCSPAGTTDAVGAALAGCARVMVPDGLSIAVPDGVEVVTDTGLTAAELDAVDAVVTEAALGIAETGTIVLDHGPGQGRRALSLVPDRHVCVVRADQVVPDVPQAVAALDPRRPQTWVSGPSATSDIELSRVEGVHGPRTLHVVLVTLD